MSDGQPRRVAEVVAELGRLGISADTRRQRQTLTNRLVDMTERGELVRIERGVYKLASPSDVAGSDNAGQTRTTSGNPR